MGIRQINVQDLKSRLDAGEKIYLIDVREPWEHDLAALPDHLLLPLGELGSRLEEVKPPEGATVITYCHHGVRSLNAAAILASAGIDAYSLSGGIDQWSAAVDPSV